MKASLLLKATASMRVLTQVVGLHVGDSAPSLMVVTDSNRYLFNVNEGLQRFCTEHRVRLVKLDGIFLSSLSSDCVGGLPGMLLTVADMGKKSLSIHGGPGLTDYLRATRHFMRRDDVQIDAVEVPDPGQAASSSLLTPVVRPELAFFPIPVVARQQGAARAQPLQAWCGQAAPTANPTLAAPTATAAALEHGNSSHAPPRVFIGPFNPLRAHAWPSRTVLATTPTFPAAAVDAASTSGSSPTGHAPPPTAAPTPAAAPAPVPPSAIAVSYLCATAPLVGKFHPARAAALGIPPGPLYGRLQKGETVTAPIPLSVALERGLVAPGEVGQAQGRLAAWRDAVAAAAAAVNAGAVSATSSSGGGEGDAVGRAAAPSFSNDVAPSAMSAAGGTGGAPASSDKRPLQPTKKQKAAAAAAALASGIPAPTLSITVRPADVKDPDLPGPAFAFVACPSSEFIEALAEHPAWAPYLAAPLGGWGLGSGAAEPASSPTLIVDASLAGPRHEVAAGLGAYSYPDAPAPSPLHVLYHAAPSHVTCLPPYASWMASFGPGVHHVLLSSGGSEAPCPSGAPFMHFAQARQAVVMHLLHPRSFTLPFPFSAQARGLPDLRAEFLRLRDSRTRGDPPAPAAALAPSSTVVASGGQAAPLAPGHPCVHGAWPLLQRHITPTPAALRELLSQRKGGAGGGGSPGIGTSVQAGASAPSAAATAPCSCDFGPGLAQSTASLSRELAAFAAEAEEGAGQGPSTAAAASDCNARDEEAGEQGEEVAVAPLVEEWLRSPSPSAPNPPAAAGVGPPGTPHPLPAAAAVVFTGTSSAVPSKYRNVTGIFVKLRRGGASLLLDCGEGTYGQLFRRFGPPGAPPPPAPGGDDSDDNLGFAGGVEAAMRGLRLVWISHMHADHHLGLPRIIAKRAEAWRAGQAAAAAPSSSQTAAAAVASPPPLLVVGPSRLFSWLSEYGAVDGSIAGNWTFADAEHFRWEAGEEGAEPPYARGSSSAPAPCARDNEQQAGGAPLQRSLGAEDYGMDVDAAVGEDPAGCADYASSALPPKRMRLELEQGGSSGGSGSGDSRLYTTAAPGSAAAAMEGGAGAAEGGSEAGEGGEAGVRAFSSSSSPAVSLAASARRPPYYHPMSACGGEAGGCPACTAPLPAPASQSFSAAPAPRAPARQHTACPHAIAAALAGLGVESLSCVPVEHCAKAYAVRLDCSSGASEREEGRCGDTGAEDADYPQGPWSLVYSGDTRPCAAVVALGRLGLPHEAAAHPFSHSHASAAAGLRPSPLTRFRLAAGGAPRDPGGPPAPGCSLLIHEATFEDSEAGRVEALDKRHSTVGEAMAVSDAMGARHTLLTHFSARYPKLPVLGAPAKLQGADAGPAALAAAPHRSVFVAYDLMTVRGSDFHSLPRLLPLLHAMFKDEATVPDEAATLYT